MFKGGDYDIKVICNHHEKIEELSNISDFRDLDIENQSILIFFSGTDDLNTLIERHENAILKVADILKRFDYSLRF